MSSAQRAGAVGLFVVAVVAGVLIASFAVGAIGGPSGTPSPAAVVSPSAPGPSPSEATSVPPASASPAASASPSASASPEPTLTPTSSPGRPATFTVTQLKLDAAEDPDGLDRELHFQADGTGAVSAKLTSISPQGQTVMCLRTPAKDLGCTTTADGDLGVQHKGAATDYTLTLRGDGIAAPVVEVTVTFPATAPEVTIANARFDGTAFPDFNGIQVVITPRVDGQLGLLAEWGGHPLLYEIDLTEQGGPGGGTLADQGPATRVDIALPVTAPNAWKLVVQNIETGFGTTGMTASITWP